MIKTLVAACGIALLANAAHASKELSDSALAAVLIALDDEYHAIAVYDALIDEFGTNTPFSSIKVAEERHAAALIDLLEKYDQPIPTNAYLDGTKSLETLPVTLTEAYEAGIAGEVTNIALYEDVLIPQVSAYPDITNVFTSLMTASATRHLPVFTACAENRCAVKSNTVIIRKASFRHEPHSWEERTRSGIASQRGGVSGRGDHSRGKGSGGHSKGKR